MNPDVFTITPETRVGPLLDRFPNLEEPLMKLSPAFSKLRNPLLRKTVAKVATLQQVAKIGDVPVGSIINTLRQSLGIEEQWSGSENDSQANESVPSWFNSKRISVSLDAAPILESGEHPLNIVMNGLRDLQAGQIYELITPFVPAPLLDAVAKKGFEVWSQKQKDGSIHSYFCKVSFEV